MNHARDQLDLTGVNELLESWRRVAWLTTARGRQEYDGRWLRPCTVYARATEP